MGPYCNFCGRRCFTHLPEGTPQSFLETAKEKGYSSLILATCARGKECDTRVLGFNISDILNEIDKGGDADK